MEDEHRSHRFKRRCHSNSISMPEKRAPISAVDLVIEQWYADPYERDDPQAAAPVSQRRLNLENVMRNRGFAQHRLRPVITWLMRCNGQYRDFDDRHGKERSGCRRRTITAAAETPVHATGDNAVPEDYGSVHKVDTGVCPNSPSAEGFEAAEEEVTPTRQELEKILGDRFEPPAIDDKRCPLDDEQWLIKALKCRLRFWDIIYGDQLPALVDDGLKFTWFRGPVPKAVRKRKTQGFLPLQEVEIDGQSFLTEDLNFGLTDGRRDGDIDKNEGQVETGGKNVVPKTHARGDDWEAKWLKLLPEPRFSAGYRETWKEIEASRKNQIHEDACKEIDLNVNLRTVSKDLQP